MTYYVLDESLLPSYLSKIQPVLDVLEGVDDLDISEIGDGNLNYVYRVVNRQNPVRSIIVKQAVPYLRVEGESWPLSRNRILFETRALTLYNKITPDYVPDIIFADESMSLIVMQDLGRVTVLRYEMVKGVVYPNLGQQIGKFLARSLFQTSYLCMESVERRNLMHSFILNDELCKLTEDFIFTFPFIDHPSNYNNRETVDYALNVLGADTLYMSNVLFLKELFMSKADALLHGDLHTGSLMVGPGGTFVIDVEFAFFGPFGFDVGKIIANFLLCYTSHFHRPDGLEYQSWLLGECISIWEAFEAEFLSQWNAKQESALLHRDIPVNLDFERFKRDFMSKILKESIGFCACCIARRTVGLAGVVDIRGITDISLRTKLEKINIDLSHKLMLQSSMIDSIYSFQSFVANFFSTQSV
jgi:5-methylthioribose kinase